MWDCTVPMIGLAMKVDTLEHIPVFELPSRYGWRYFQPGDERRWAEIEMSAGEFKTPEEGLKGFRRYYPTDEHLDQRMIFLTDNGVPFSTATAWFGSMGPQDRMGWLHWVSVDDVHQGQGLSKVVVSLAMHRIRELGHCCAGLSTQTASWVAIKVYHQFGFKPQIIDPAQIEGWKIVSDKTGIDFIKEIQ